MIEYYKYDTEYPYMHPCNRDDECDAKFVPLKQFDIVDTLLKDAITILEKEGLIVQAGHFKNKRDEIG